MRRAPSSADPAELGNQAALSSLRGMVVRIVATVWALAAMGSAVAVTRGLLVTRGRHNLGETVTRLLSVTRRIGKAERYTSLILAGACVAAFFGGYLNTDLWPLATTAWVALLFQSMFLRPYMSNYAELIERGFERPIERFLVPYIVLDVVMVVPLVALVLQGTQ